MPPTSFHSQIPKWQTAISFSYNPNQFSTAHYNISRAMRKRIASILLVVMLAYMAFTLGVAIIYKPPRPRADYTSGRLPLATIENMIDPIVCQMHKKAYSLICRIMWELAPGNVLVFGLGADSVWYIASNYKGRTVFIENDAEWIQKVHEDGLTRGGEVYHYRYDTKVSNAEKYLRELDPAVLDMTVDGQLPANVTDSRIYWDLVLIDAPKGKNEDSPGRMKACVLVVCVGLC